MFDTKLKDIRNDGVSPVIGVILMVAITVILAAVIGTFVLGLADDLDQDAQAAVTFDENEGQEVVVQLNSVQSADAVRVDIPSDASIASGGVSESGTGSGSYLVNTNGDGGVGTSVTVSTSGADDGTITVIGTLDGSDNVIQTYEYVGGN